MAALQQPDMHAVDRERVADDLDRPLHDVVRSSDACTTSASSRRTRWSVARSISTTRSRVSSRTIVFTDVADELDLRGGAVEVDADGEVART